MVSSKEIVQMKDKQQQQRPREKNKKQKNQLMVRTIRFDGHPLWRRANTGVEVHWPDYYEKISSSIPYIDNYLLVES